MQVTEISAEGLKRQYKVVLPAADLASKLDGELAELRSKAQIKGFRPGKVPTAHLRRLYGKSLMSDVVENAVNEANRKIVEENKLRLALAPKVDLASDRGELEQALEAKGDLAFTVALETLPQFDVGSFDDLELERLVAEIDESEVDKSVARLVDIQRPFADKPNGAAETGDKVTIDFNGTIAGEAFEGGSGVDVPVTLGANEFIPGFEDQLVGAKAGEERRVEVKFPENYLSPKLAGQEAVFDVTVKAIKAPEPYETDDAFATGIGFENLEALKNAIREQYKGELSKMSRDKLKRALLDALDKRFAFELPEGLVSQEFTQIWRQVEAEQQQSGRSFADEKTTEEEQRAEYRKIAERRVRLGLVLADVGEKAAVKVDDAELARALTDMARQYPGEEKQVWEFYRKNPQALAQVRAPLFEEKVVDHIIAQAKVHDRTVSREELMKPDEDAQPVKAGEGAALHAADAALEAEAAPAAEAPSAAEATLAAGKEAESTAE